MHCPNHGYSATIYKALLLICLGGQLVLGHTHTYYDNYNDSHHNNVISYNSHDQAGNYKSYGGNGGYSSDEGGNDSGDEEEMHKDGNSYYFLGHPTGVAVHPLLSPPHKPFNISDQKSDDKVTDILHGLLAKYDNRIRPFSPERSTMILVAILGFQVVDVDESKSEFSSTVLLQQTWMDPRLAYDLSNQTEVPYITISHEHTRELWLPDTFFINEKKAQIHEMTMTNDAALLFSNGSVVRSTRITVSTYCPFDYKNFPFESQQCELLIGSHGYGDTDIELFWDENYIMMAESPEKESSWKNVFADVHTGKFLVTDLSFKESTEKTNLGKKSRLSLQATLQRAWRPFITRFYMPMVLFVFVSLGTLFLNDFKVALIVNLFNLAFVNIFIAIRSSSEDTPRTSTRTSLDTYFIICLTYILPVVLITVYKLTKQGFPSKATPLTEASQPSQSTFSAERRISSNRRPQNDQLDIFNPMNHTRREEITAGGSSSHHNHHHPHFQNGHGTDGESSAGDHDGVNGNEYERIYRSPSYPLHLSSRTRVVLRKVEKFMFWLGKYLRWILLISFLITDYGYFKAHTVQYN